MKRFLAMMILIIVSFQSPTWAEEAFLPAAKPTPILINRPTITPSPPLIHAKAYMLIDANSGKILAEKNSATQLPPASLTKMMTLYVISNALKQRQVTLNDQVHISENAWRAEGSRMFIKVNDEVSMEALIKGIIVDSGNDACVAVAEHIGGSEAGFVQIMNDQARSLGMTHSHFTDSTGLPNPQHYTTARDLAILARALINNFPEYYPWYQQKWFTYNHIKQPNRNRLLWRSGHVDGIKTGHTADAGFCLVSSAKQQNMRLIAVILGAPSDNARADDSEHLLNYGFHFYETHLLYQAKQPIKTVPIYQGKRASLSLIPKDDIYLTIPIGQFKQLHAVTRFPNALRAPIQANQQVGELIFQLDQTPIATHPLYAAHTVEQGGILTRIKDSLRLSFRKLVG